MIIRLPKVPDIIKTKMQVTHSPLAKESCQTQKLNFLIKQNMTVVIPTTHSMETEALHIKTVILIQEASARDFAADKEPTHGKAQAQNIQELGLMIK